MATILQTQLIEFLTPIFIFLLIFVMLYALLQKSKALGGVKGFDAIAAFAVAILFIVVPEGTIFIKSFTPWMLIFGVLVFVVFLFFMFLGVSSSTMVNLAKNSVFVTFAVILIGTIFLISLSQALGPFLLTNTEAGFWNATKRTIFHPKMLGAIFILAMASFSIKFIAENQ
tara:strand:- start:10212 stop:10724 length:513 start_codon:yes stop_codon:yes gene_type:complete